MRKNLGFRAWYYFRIGWSNYFAFIIAAINTMVVTYYLAIGKIPSLKEIFPTFFHYALIWIIVGIPVLVAVGYIHYKRISAYHAESDILAESHPYNYKLPPGVSIEVIFPLYLAMTKMMIKWASNEKLSDDDLKQIAEMQKKMDLLIKGGSIKGTKISDSNLYDNQTNNELE